MPVASKVRIYDLARDLKQDTKRIMEDLRREGADVSVPSNSVSKELAEKIRSKYFPKAEIAPKRFIKVIKKKSESESEAETETPQIETETPEIETAPEITEIEEIPQEISHKPAIAPAEPKKDTSKIKALTKKVELPQPEEPVIAEEIEPQPAEIVEEAEIPTEIEAVAETPAPAAQIEEMQKPMDRVKVLAPKVLAPKVFRPTGTQVKQLTLTKDALLQGIKPGERVISEAPSKKTGKFNLEEKAKPKDRKDFQRTGRGDRKPELRGTPGESANPIMTYTPNQNQRRPEGRGGGKKGGKTFGDKNNRHQEVEFSVPRPRSIEERIRDQVGRNDSETLKTARLTEGATVYGLSVIW